MYSDISSLKGFEVDIYLSLMDTYPTVEGSHVLNDHLAVTKAVWNLVALIPFLPWNFFYIIEAYRAYFSVQNFVFDGLGGHDITFEVFCDRSGLYPALFFKETFSWISYAVNKMHFSRPRRLDSSLPFLIQGLLHGALGIFLNHFYHTSFYNISRPTVFIRSTRYETLSLRRVQSPLIIYPAESALYPLFYNAYSISLLHFQS